MKKCIASAFLGAVLLASCGNPDVQKNKAAKPKEAEQALIGVDGAPLGRLGSNVTPTAYRLALTIDPDKETFVGETEIDVTLIDESARIWLHGDGLTMGAAYAVTADGARIDAAYEQVDVTGVARLDFAKPVPSGRSTLHFSYQAPFQNSADGLYRAEEGGRYYAASQLESIAAREVFPGFDEPRFKTPFDISITAKDGDAVVTNTPEASAAPLEGNLVRHVFATTKPLPTYLLAFAVGPYDINEHAPMPANDVRAETTPLRGVTAAGKGDRITYALDHTGEIVNVLENYFDVPYPYEKLDIIAAPDFFGGAMENAGAIIYSEYLMLMDEGSAFSQRRAYAHVHAHELAHQWFGDYVTPAWWDDIWLNESFASWMEYKAADIYWPEGQFGRSVIQDGFNAMAKDSLASARRIREPVVSNATIDDSFDGVTYEKGGAVLNMFESYLGEEAFRNGVRTYMKRHAYGTATVNDFLQALADGSGRKEVIPAFQSFIDQPGTPLLSVSLSCDGEPKLTIRQSRYAPLGSKIDTAETWRVPMCAAYGTEDGQGRTCGMIEKTEDELLLDANVCPTFVEPNGDGSGYFRFALDEDAWKALTAASSGLDPKQALAYIDSLDAAFRANVVSADMLLDGFAKMSRHPAWDVVSETMHRYETLFDVAPEALNDLQALGRAWFRPVYDSVQGADDPQSLLLRDGLTHFMLVIAEDSELRAGVLDNARRYVGINGAPDTHAIDPNLVESVLTVGVQEDGEPFFDALLNLTTASDDPAYRRSGIGALARTGDPTLARRLLDAVAEDSFSANEMNRAMYRLLARRETQDVAWTWIKEHIARLMERNSGIFGSRSVVRLGGFLCSAEKEAEYRTLILDHAEQLPGYERTFAQSLESIDLCMALADAKGEEFAEAVAARR